MELWQNDRLLAGIASQNIKDIEMKKDFMQEMRVFLWEHRENQHTNSCLLQKAKDYARDQILRTGKSIDSIKRKKNQIEFSQEPVENPMSRIETKIDVDKIEKKLTGSDLKLFKLLRSGFNLVEISQKLKLNYKALNKRKLRMIKKLQHAF